MSATFDGADTTTHGATGIATYAGDGGGVPSTTIAPGVSRPPYITLFTTPGTGNEYVENQHVSDTAALQRPGGPDGFKSVWYEPSGAPLAVTLRTTWNCKAALYFWDDGADRVQTVQVFDDDTNASLDTQAVPAPFTNGNYLIWTLTPGKYRFEVTRTSGSNTTVAAFLFSEGEEPDAPAANSTPLLFTF